VKAKLVRFYLFQIVVFWVSAFIQNIFFASNLSYIARFLQCVGYYSSESSCGIPREKKDFFRLYADIGVHEQEYKELCNTECNACSMLGAK